LKKEGRTGAVGFGIYPIDLWERIFRSVEIDAALVHNHYCLHDTRLLGLLPLAREKGIGIINCSALSSALLTEQGPAEWHPASAGDRAVFREAAEFCRAQGTSLTRLALQFASQYPDIPTTLFSAAGPEYVIDNVRWSEEVRNRNWNCT
jgi:L-galactose dehydrogenase